jgi:hypothetical protein
MQALIQIRSVVWNEDESCGFIHTVTIHTPFVRTNRNGYFITEWPNRFALAAKMAIREYSQRGKTTDNYLNFSMNKKDSELKESLHQPKQIDEILKEQIQTAMHEHNRSHQDLFFSAFSRA